MPPATSLRPSVPGLDETMEMEGAMGGLMVGASSGAELGAMDSYMRLERPIVPYNTETGW